MELSQKSLTNDLPNRVMSAGNFIITSLTYDAVYDTK